MVLFLEACKMGLTGCLQVSAWLLLLPVSLLNSLVSCSRIFSFIILNGRCVISFSEGIDLRSKVFLSYVSVVMNIVVFCFELLNNQTFKLDKSFHFFTEICQKMTCFWIGVSQSDAS